MRGWTRSEETRILELCVSEEELCDLYGGVSNDPSWPVTTADAGEDFSSGELTENRRGSMGCVGKTIEARK